MDIEEEISERIIRQAFEGGGEVIFTDTELKECTDRKLLQKVNLQLSLYGAIFNTMYPRSPYKIAYYLCYTLASYFIRIPSIPIQHLQDTFPIVI